jgi:hypothetical protein
MLVGGSLAKRFAVIAAGIQSAKSPRPPSGRSGDGSSEWFSRADRSRALVTKVSGQSPP